MQKKTFNLIVGVTGGIAAIASAVVAFIQPAYAPAIIASISIAETAITEIVSQFVKS